MKKFFCLSLVVFATIFFGCMSDGTTIVLPDHSNSSSSSTEPGSSSSSTEPGSPSSSTEPGSPSSSTQCVYDEPVLHGGETYKTVVIGTQTWFQRNLNYDVGGKCYDDDTDNCAKYGRLYDWATAMNIDVKYNDEKWGGSDEKHQGICPGGWHIPNFIEQVTLELFVKEATKLKSKNEWNDNNGTDDYCFSALPGGEYMLAGYVACGGVACFYGVGSEGTFMSSTEEDDKPAWNINMSISAYKFSSVTSKKGFLHSVRCIRD